MMSSDGGYSYLSVTGRLLRTLLLRATCKAVLLWTTGASIVVNRIEATGRGGPL
jgi:hypothetical protein